MHARTLRAQTLVPPPDIGIKFFWLILDFQCEDRLCQLGKPQIKKCRVYLGIAQMGGGSRPLPKWFGALILRRIVHVQRGICLVWGGLNPCQDGLGHLCSENWSSNGICSSRSGNKVPQSARLSEGGGCNRYLGNAQIDPAFFEVGLP